jgi:exosortase/archaeosortase family protein
MMRVVAALFASPARRFAIRFALLAGLLLGLYYFPYANGGSVKGILDAYLRGYASIAGGVLRWFEPTLVVQGQNIIGRYSLRIVKTCDAMDTQILFASAVIAWPAAWRLRAIAAVWGVVAMSALNVVRICSLYYVGILLPSFFDIAHLDVWPAVIVLSSVAGFVAFVSWTRRVDHGLADRGLTTA